MSLYDWLLFLHVAAAFALVAALAMIGEDARARALFGKLLSFAGPLLLYAEEIDAASGQHLGNYPQAFTHLALIDAALQRAVQLHRSLVALKKL